MVWSSGEHFELEMKNWGHRWKWKPRESTQRECTKGEEMKEHGRTWRKLTLRERGGEQGAGIGRQTSSRVGGKPGENAVTEAKGIETSKMGEVNSTKFWKELK